MSNSNGRITAPVEIRDVQQVLGISEGGDLARLIINGNINRYSLYKPIEYETFSVLSLSQIESTNCGFDIPSFNPNVKGAIESFIASKGRWIYRKPTSAYRLQDFESYDHNAVDDVFTVYASPTTVYISDDRDDIIMFRVLPGSDLSTNVSLKHLPLLKNKYLGLILWNLSSGPNNGVWAKVNQELMLNADGTINNAACMIQCNVKDTPYRIGATMGVICGLWTSRSDPYSIIYSLNYMGDLSDAIWNNMYREIRIAQYVPPFVLRYTVSWDFQMSVTSDGYFTLSSIKCTLYTKDNPLLNTAKTIQVRFLATGSTNNVWHTKTDVAYCQISQAANTTRTWTFTKTDSSRAKFPPSMGVVQVEVFNVSDNQKFVSDGVIRVYGSSQSAGLTLGTQNAV